MTVKRLLLALPVFALLGACGGDAPSDDGRAASGEVLEGTISDAMLPVDRVRSEPPLEDPEAFAEAVGAEGGPALTGGAAPTDDDTDGEQAADVEAEGPAPEAAPEGDDE